MAAVRYGCAMSWHRFVYRLIGLGEDGPFHWPMGWIFSRAPATVHGVRDRLNHGRVSRRWSGRLLRSLKSGWRGRHAEGGWRPRARWITSNERLLISPELIFRRPFWRD